MLFGKVDWCWGPDSQQWFRYSVGCLLTGLISLSSCWTWIAAPQKWPTMQTASALRMRTVQNLPPITCQGPWWLRQLVNVGTRKSLSETKKTHHKNAVTPWVFPCFSSTRHHSNVQALLLWSSHHWRSTSSRRTWYFSPANSLHNGNISAGTVWQTCTLYMLKCR